ncbi:hypothetical protein BCR44DRAFT_1496204 [Catenaria anguillulae PL171]|uniref:Uncharacterized protein n=1 Tax=Catenaria anguillulae PL171 TaxID=765915 RepID=A0A1Y2I246_9FUNG|nr:hypothetical protein BCR44DRAFT_1496204 [Catenaria anguillulae PL171]
MSFFTVKYGDNNAERLFNTNCMNTVLLSHIKHALELDFAEPVDLATDAGDILDLISKPKEYARKSIEPRSVCTLLKVVKDDEDGSIVYVPLAESAALEKSLKMPGGAAGRRMTKRNIFAAGGLNSSGNGGTDEGGKRVSSPGSHRSNGAGAASGGAAALTSGNLTSASSLSVAPGTKGSTNTASGGAERAERAGAGEEKTGAGSPAKEGVKKKVSMKGGQGK